MAENKDNNLLQATDFTPLEASGNRQKMSISPGYIILGIAFIFAAIVLVYLFLARSVIFLVEPPDAVISTSGLNFHIGDNFLLLRGEHQLSAQAEGYFPLQETIIIGDESSQEIKIALEPLPGNLEISSEIQDIQVRVDNEDAGMVPGLLEGLSKGKHKLEFIKHRYFPFEQEIEIEGQGITQSLPISLVPAWGQMEFSTAPAGVDLFIDDQLIGQTPLTTEVLETGSHLRLTTFGYKTWEKHISATAGETQAYPPIELTIADGTLNISSAPSSAGVTIDRTFKGNTPLTVALSPLGEHRVELILEGYSNAVRNVTVKPEQKSSLAVDLKAIIGKINLTVAPADAEVQVDGKVYGVGKQLLALTAKEHTVTVGKPGYKAQVIKVIPRPEHEQSIDVTLLTIQDDYWSSRPPKITSPVGSTLLLFRTNAEFTLGAPRRQPGRKANEAQRKVILERPFYLGTHEVTNGQYRQWYEEHSSSAINANTLDMDDQPVVRVTWQNAALFCNWLSLHQGLPSFYIVDNGAVTGFDPDSHGFRLPTEAEWAWAAKVDDNGATQIFPWGTNSYPPTEAGENYADQSAAGFLPFTLTHYNDGHPVSAPVASSKPNARGLYDMSGNVAEWIHDFYDVQPNMDDPQLDSTGPQSGNRHVVRGASWSLGSRTELRLSYRDAGTDGRTDLGFRLARYVDKAGATQ